MRVFALLVLAILAALPVVAAAPSLPGQILAHCTDGVGLQKDAMNNYYVKACAGGAGVVEELPYGGHVCPTTPVGPQVCPLPTAYEPLP